VKIIELAAIDDPAGVAETVARFRREAMILARLRHPNVVSAEDAARVGNELFMVMELADGMSLASRLQQRADKGWGRFPVRDALRVAGQACAGLAAAHAHGVVHRDVKPSNLMVSARLDVKVIDFGIARLLADNERLTLPSTALGTVAYMSPEQAEGRVDIDGRSDLYSLGCVLYELLAGRPPFTAGDPRTLMLMQVTADPDPLESLCPDLRWPGQDLAGRARGDSGSPLPGGVAGRHLRARADVVQERDRGGGAGPPPGQQRPVEGVAGDLGVDRRGDRGQDLALPPDEGAGVVAPAVQQRQLEQQVRPDVADVGDRHLQPPRGGLVALAGGGVDGALRPLAGLSALRRDQPRLG
jgi:eukaryotic-like serine/threonine-protein kinase